MHLDITTTKGNFWYLVLLINLSPMSVSDVQRSLQSCVSTIQSVGLTADVFQRITSYKILHAVDYQVYF